MFSAVHPTTDIAKIFRHVRFVPGQTVSRLPGLAPRTITVPMDWLGQPVALRTAPFGARYLPRRVRLFRPPKDPASSRGCHWCRRRSTALRANSARRQRHLRHHAEDLDRHARLTIEYRDSHFASRIVLVVILVAHVEHASAANLSRVHRGIHLKCRMRRAIVAQPSVEFASLLRVDRGRVFRAFVVAVLHGSSPRNLGTRS